MIQEPFAAGNSWVHRIDNRLRILFAVVFSLLIALSKGFPMLAAALAFSIGLVGLAKLNARQVIRRLLTVFWFLILIWVVLPLTYEGDLLFQVGPLAIKRPGIVLAAQITLKAASILMIFMSLIATMPIATLGHSLNRLHLPPKLVHLLLMTYRYIFVIEEEYQRLKTAITIRGFRSGTTIHAYKTYAYLIGMLFVRASVRAERVHQAMRCRGFKGRFYTLDDFSSAGQNRRFIVLMMMAIMGLLILEWFYGR